MAELFSVSPCLRGWDGNRLILYTWNTALNQLRDILSLSSGTLTIIRATEQQGPSTNATLIYTKGPS